MFMTIRLKNKLSSQSAMFFKKDHDQ